jgi:hypothetical protein
MTERVRERERARARACERERERRKADRLAAETVEHRNVGHVMEVTH